MTNSTKIVNTLKQQLKHRGITYKALARQIKLSESAVKHMFSTGNLSIKRLDELCAILELDIGELVNIAEFQEARIEELSADLEHELVADIRLLLVAYCLINYWTFDEILERYSISRDDGIKLLNKLDRMMLIDLQPGNRVRLLISNNFSWRKNGAIEKFFRGQVQAEFFDSSFSDEGAIRIVKNGVLSKKGQVQLADRLQAFGEQFDDISRDERKLTASQRQGTTMVLAIRNWSFEGFRQLER
jgi:DNA-binding Xre family transcriptional regulator